MRVKSHALIEFRTLLTPLDAPTSMTPAFASHQSLDGFSRTRNAFAAPRGGTKSHDACGPTSTV